MSRRVVVAVAVPVGVYAVLLVISLLGGPRIGAPWIPLPGGGGVEAATPVIGPPLPGEAGETLPSIPHEATPTPSPPPLSSAPPDEKGQPGQPPATSGPVDGHPSTAASLPAEPSAVEPTPGVAERRNPSMPPATKTPSAPPPTDPPGTPSTPPTVTPSEPPDQPKPPTLADTLLVLLGVLRR
ncbi:hypothetical protein [Kribbella catacumbae]|uniref:hypothetical protein n=1 Tax=Kribbella catacumbae TaxID=460086 RepID=UPI0003A8A117|nr:hypothetical protein [Kribbella catacumbae]